MQLSKYTSWANSAIRLRNSLGCCLLNLSSNFPAYSTTATTNNTSVNNNQTSQELKKNDYNESENNSKQQELDELYKRVVIQVRGHDKAVLNSYEKFATLTSSYLDCPVEVIRPRRSQEERIIERWTLLKSRFGNRKHMRQYEIRTYSRELILSYLTGSTCDTILEYLQRNLPEGVAMHVHKTRIEPLPEHFKET